MPVRKLRWRLLLLTLIAVGPTSFAFLFHIDAMKAEEALEKEARARNIAKTVAVLHEQHVKDAEAVLRSLAEIPAVRQGAGADCTKILAIFDESLPGYTRFLVIDRRGIMTCAGQPVTEEVDLSDREYFQRAKTSGRFVLSDYLIGRLSGKPVVVAAYPIKDAAGEAEGLVAAGLGLEWFHESLNGLALPKGTKVALVDKNGTVLARHGDSGDDEDTWFKLPAGGSQAGARSGPVSHTEFHDSGRVTVYQPLSKRIENVYVAVSATRWEANGLVTRLIEAPFTVPVLSLGILVLLLGGHYRLIFRKLDALTAASDRLAAGDYAARSGIAHGGDEFGQVAGAFDSMAERLARHAAELREREKRIRAVVETVVDGIITIDDGGVIQNVNPAALRLFGYDETELVGSNVAVLMPEPYRSEHEGYLERYLKTGEARIIGVGREVEGRRKDGSTFPMELAVSEMQLGAERIFTGVVRDVTERKRWEETLKLAKDAAESANRAKSRFLASMSHELRTPLNAIIGYSEMLEEDAREAGDEHVVADLEKINAAGQHLLALINDILDLSKVEAGRMELSVERFEVAKVLQEAVSTIEPLVEKSGSVLEMDCSASVGEMESDVTKVRQVLFNLLSNAAKFTEGGHIELAARRESGDDGDWLVIRVSDTGIGISAEQMTKLFEPFAQAGADTAKHYGGTGLGLAICRRHCELLKGSIEAESEPGVGSVFTVRLPAVIEAQGDREGPAALAEAEPPRLVGERADQLILVVDDDESARDLLTRQLEAEGHQVAMASGGEAGLRMAQELKPDLITLDVLMPDLDGWSVLEALKRSPETADIPVMMCTIIDDRQRGYLLGATDYLTKPIERGALARTLNKYWRADASSRVLVVEDDAPTRELLCRTLEKAGWEVDAAEHGKDALARLVEETTPDLILLDLMMPEMDGFEFLDAIRANPQWREISVVVVTAKNLTEADRRQLNGYVQSVVTKGGPNGTAFLDEVRSLLRRAMGRERRSGQERRTGEDRRTAEDRRDGDNGQSAEDEFNRE